MPTTHQPTTARSPANRNSRQNEYRISASKTDLYVVSVTDSVTETLAGHSGLTYTSPPQPYHDALRLAAGLLGHHPNPTANDAQAGRWTTGTAGGRRLVTLTPDHQGDDHGNPPRR